MGLFPVAAPLPLAPTSELDLAGFQAVITAGLAIFALVLYRRLPQRWVAWWAAAWGLYVLRLLAITAFLRTGQLAWLFWHQVATAWVALAILWAALAFSRNVQWRPIYAAWALFPMVWAWVAIHALDRLALVALPTVALIAGATLWTGLVFWRYANRERSAGARFVAIAFFLWGLHHLDYTVLRARGAWEPWGYFLDIVFELGVGIGFGVMALSELANRLTMRTGELGQLSTLMVQQHEAERRRLSHELHDETAQTLSAVKLEVGMLREGADPAAEAGLDRVLHLVDDGIRGIRRVMNDLRPTLLDELGLLPAIRSLADDVRDRSGLVIEVDTPESAPRMPPATELAIFRAAQEALANVVRHAHASRVWLTLRLDGESLHLQVVDDGRGLGGYPARGPGSEPHLGIAGMRERITALGGTARVTESGAHGVAVMVDVPLHRAAAGTRASDQLAAAPLAPIRDPRASSIR